jgi:plastocyanin
MKIVLALVGLLAAVFFETLGDEVKFFHTMSDVGLVKYSESEPPSNLVSVPADGKISGKVYISKAGGTSARSAKGLYGKSASRLSKNTSADKKAVVFIVKAPGKYPLPQSRPVMRQKNVAIVPHVLPVIVGSTVDFPNEDDIYHNIFSLSQTKTFDLGRYSKGKSKSVTFNNLGTVKVFCDIHSQMGGVIRVLQNPSFAAVGIDGSYTISGIPPGNYELAAWQENEGNKIQKVTVSSGEQTSVDFSF